MKLLSSSSERSAQVDEMSRTPSNDMIRSGSIKSGGISKPSPLEMEAPGSSSGRGPSSKHSWFNTAGLGLLFLLSAAALGVAIWGAAEGVSNSNAINDIRQMASDGTLLPPTSTGDDLDSSTVGSSSEFNSSAANYWPEVVLRRDPNPVEGYTYQASLYRGSGYWAPRPSIEMDAAAAWLSVASNGNMAYITGGRQMVSDGRIITSSSVYRFDAVLGLYGDAKSMPEPRSAHASAYLNGLVYVIGGYKNGDDMLNGVAASKMMVYNASTDEWTTMEGPNKPRGRACAVAINGRIYVAGGFKSDQTATDTVEVFDPETKEWAEFAKLPFGRGGCGCASSGDLMYVAGGTRYFEAETKTGATSEFVSVNTADGKVTKLAAMNGARSGLQLVAANDADGSILAVGGMMLAQNGNSIYQVGNGIVEAYLPAHEVWVEKAPMATPRFGAAAMAATNGAYVFGGNAVCEQSTGQCNALSSVEVFEFSDVPDVFVFTMDAAAASARPYGSSAPSSDVILTGQHNGTMASTNGELFDVVGSLYQGAGYWAQREPMPMGSLNDFTLISVPNANGERAGAYFIGGANGETVSDAMWLFDAYLQRWTELAPMPEPRYRHAAAMVNGRIYIMGGFSNWSNSVEGIPSRDMIVYDIAAGVWEQTENGPQTPRSDACAAAVDGRVYYAGGYSAGFAAALSSIEVFDPDVATWYTVPPMPTPRGDCMCASLNSQLLVLGGYYDPTNEWTPNSFRREVEAFDPSVNQWSSLAPMPASRGDMALVTLPNGRLMVMGGETTSEDASRTMVASNQVAQYIAAQDVWVPKAPMIEDRFRFGAAYVADYVMVVGGQRSGATGSYDEIAPGLASTEAFFYAQSPDVFVWMKVNSD